MKTKLLFSFFSIFGITACTHAATYFVSPQGNDSNSGTSVSSPWQTVGRVNQQALEPGDVVRFQGGAVFTDAGIYIDHWDAGNAGNPVIVESYGTGRAHIKPPSGQHGLFIYNTAGVLVRNLIFDGGSLLTNTQVGIFAYTDLPSDTMLEGITVVNCEVSDFYYGIVVGAWASDSSFSGFKDVLIDSCLVHTCRRDGIMTYGFYPGSQTQQSHENIIIRDCEVYGVTGDPTLTDNHSGSGIIISGVIGGLIERCYAHHNGGNAGNPSGGGPVGIWTWNSDSVTIQYCLVHDQKTTPGVKDGGGFDIDGGSTNALIQYCYSYNNEGPGYLVAGFNNAPPINNGTFRYNISWRDGRRTGNNMASGFHFWRGSGTTLQNILVHNNLVYTESSTGGAAVRHQSGAMSNIRLHNNLFVVKGGERFIHIPGTSAYTFQGNAYWAIDNNWNGGWRWGSITYNSLDSWRLASGNPETLSATNVGLQVDPMISGLEQGAQPTSIAEMLAMDTFQLLEGSPMKAAGINLYEEFGVDPGHEDFFGNILSAVGAPNIGVHETAVHGVLTPDSVFASGYQSPNYPENAFDQDPDTRWASGYGSWLAADFGSAQTMAGVELAFFNGASRSYEFQIEFSNDGNNWTPVWGTHRFSSGQTAGPEIFDFSDPITARYIRYVGFGNSSNGWNSLHIFNTLSTLGETVIFAPFSVSASSFQSPNDPENAFDHDLNTRWAAGNGSWLEADLGTSRTLTEVELVFYLGGSRSYEFRIETSTDRTNWSSVWSSHRFSGQSAGPETFTFPDPVTARYVRYVGFGNSINGWNSLHVFHILGTP
ncbi:MAG: discoidin domain-containing protein [Verrucomicrobia bacterium]|nr:discoidin domain-containing protein [Verrucomicrobiota bacterium]MCH8526641.1 discoidin domain-containing protein [Kiritimatiellia bacterium]